MLRLGRELIVPFAGCSSFFVSVLLPQIVIYLTLICVLLMPGDGKCGWASSQLLTILAVLVSLLSSLCHSVIVVVGFLHLIGPLLLGCSTYGKAGYALLFKASGQCLNFFVSVIFGADS
jgi:hypothetical protein